MVNDHVVHYCLKKYESRDAVQFAAHLGEGAPNRTLAKTLLERANEETFL